MLYTLVRAATEGYMFPAAVSMTTVALGEHAVDYGMLAVVPEGPSVHTDIAFTGGADNILLTAV